MQCVEFPRFSQSLRLRSPAWGESDVKQPKVDVIRKCSKITLRSEKLQNPIPKTQYHVPAAARQTLEEQLELEAQYMVRSQESEESREGIGAFLEKRSADFTKLRG